MQQSVNNERTLTLYVQNHHVVEDGLFFHEITELPALSDYYLGRWCDYGKHLVFREKKVKCGLSLNNQLIKYRP